MEFLSDDNAAGQTLLRLVSRGSAIIAELLRLSDNVPVVFLPSHSIEQEKYVKILFDFKYLKSAEGYESKIDQDTVIYFGSYFSSRVESCFRNSLI